MDKNGKKDIKIASHKIKLSHLDKEFFPKAGIVKGDKRGYFTHYYVDRERLKEAASQIIELSRVVPLDKECHQGCSKEDNPCSKKEVNKK